MNDVGRYLLWCREASVDMKQWGSVAQGLKQAQRYVLSLQGPHLSLLPTSTSAARTTLSLTTGNTHAKLHAASDYPLQVRLPNTSFFLKLDSLPRPERCWQLDAALFFLRS